MKTCHNYLTDKRIMVSCKNMRALKLLTLETVERRKQTQANIWDRA